MYVNRAGHILMVRVTRQAIRAKIGPKLRKPAKHTAQPHHCAESRTKRLRSASAEWCQGLDWAKR